MAGNYEYMNEDGIDDELKCIICIQPLQSPVTTDCQHTFCQHCLETWMQEQGLCPICRHAVQTRLLVVDEKSKQLDCLLVRCLACKKNNIKRADIHQHLERCFKTKSAKLFRKPWRSIKSILKPKLNRRLRIPSMTRPPPYQLPAFNFSFGRRQRAETADRVANSLADLVTGLFAIITKITLVLSVTIVVFVFLFLYCEIFQQAVCAVFAIWCCFQFGRAILPKLNQFIGR